MPARDMLVRLPLVAAGAGMGAAGFAMAGMGQPAHAVAGLLFVGLAGSGIGYQSWYAVRMLRDRAAGPDRQCNRDRGRPAYGTPRGPARALLLPHVVAVEGVLAAQVEPAVADGRVGQTPSAGGV
jgi:hypothetical protein